MNISTNKLDVNLEGVSLKEAQLIKKALCEFNRIGFAEKWEKPIETGQKNI